MESIRITSKRLTNISGYNTLISLDSDEIQVALFPSFGLKQRPAHYQDISDVTIVSTILMFYFYIECDVDEIETGKGQR